MGSKLYKLSILKISSEIPFYQRVDHFHRNEGSKQKDIYFFYEFY